MFYLWNLEGTHWENRFNLCLNILVRGSLRKISSNESLHPKCGVGEIIAKYSNQFTLISVECNPRPGGNWYNVSLNWKINTKHFVVGINRVSANRKLSVSLPRGESRYLCVQTYPQFCIFRHFWFYLRLNIFHDLFRFNSNFQKQKYGTFLTFYW